MERQQLMQSVGYCGLVCGVCSHAHEGCKGCRKGGGYEYCYQRRCCLRNGYQGCWQCADFPCSQGFFADDEWKGLCIGAIECIKDVGMGNYVDSVVSQLGEVVDYGDYRYKASEVIGNMLRGQSGN